MISIDRPRSATLIVLGCMALTWGCQSKEPAQGDAQGPEPAPAGVAKPAPASPGKPGAPVNMEFTLQGEPRPGEVLEIELQFTPRQHVDALLVEVTAGAGLTVAAGGPARRYADARSGVIHRHTVAVIPQAEGLHYLNVLATLETDRGAQSRAFAVPVQVGSGPRILESNGKPATDQSGERIISLPADQSDSEKN